MKIIRNNCISKENKEESEKPKTLITYCDMCNSELEITEEDTHIGWLGAAFITCPCCGKESMVDELEGITLTKDNLEFPVHFHRSNKDLKGVKEVDSDEIVKDIKRAIEYFRENKDDWAWYTSYGDLFLCVYRYPGDEEYFVMVTRDYYETNISFEPQDYE